MIDFFYRQPTTRPLDVLAVLRQWKQEEDNRPPHLDPRSRWVGPIGIEFPPVPDMPTLKV